MIIDLFKTAIRIGETRAHRTIATAWEKKRELKELGEKERLIRKEAKELSVRLREMLNEEEWVQTNQMAEEILTDRRELLESEFEIGHRPKQMHMDASAVKNFTGMVIPEDVEMVLSWGPKFVFPVSELDRGRFIMEVDAMLQNRISPLFYEEAVKHVAIQLDKYRKKKGTTDMDRWLFLIENRTRTFIEKHSDLVFLRSDKGKHMVVMNRMDYEEKMMTLLGDHTTYERTRDTRDENIRKNNEFVSRLRDCGYIEHESRFRDDTATTARIYGLPKVHKLDVPLRPITSTINSPGSRLAEKLATDLRDIFPGGDLHLRNSVECKKFVDSVTLKEDEILVSYDVVSMFTNIPITLVLGILVKRESQIKNRLGITFDLLAQIIGFLLRDCAIFTYGGVTYRQIRGLAMGSSLSPLFAQIVMTDLIETQWNRLPVEPNFIRVYVDDTISAIEKKRAADMLDVLNAYHGDIRFTMETERDGSINFLDITLMRRNGGITTNWYKKEFASDRLLNYFSGHQHKTIVGTAISHIKTVINLSDESKFEENKQGLIERLRLNNFPEIRILALINEHYSLMKRPTALKGSFFLWYENFGAKVVEYNREGGQNEMIETAGDFIRLVSRMGRNYSDEGNKEYITGILERKRYPVGLIRALIRRHYGERRIGEIVTPRYAAIPFVPGLTSNIRHLVKGFDGDLRISGRPIRTRSICTRIKDPVNEEELTRSIVGMECQCGKGEILARTSYRERAGDVIMNLRSKYDLVGGCHKDKHCFRESDVVLTRGGDTEQKTEMLGRCMAYGKRERLMNRGEWSWPHRNYRRHLD